MPTNWWGNMTGAQAVQLGMNIFQLSQQQAAQQREEQRMMEQQSQENFFKKMQLDLQTQKLDLDRARQDFERQQIEAEQKSRKEEFGFEKQKWQEELGFKKESLKEETALAREKAAAKVKEAKPDLSAYPGAIAKATDLYEQTGNWGAVQAVQKQFGMPVDRVPGKAKEIKEAISIWKEVDKNGLPLKVDRKFGPGGEEQSLPQEIIEKYGAKSIEALGKLTRGMMGGVLGTDKYRERSITQLYEIYFKAKRLLNEGHDKKAIADSMKKGKLPEDLINDMLEVL